MPVGKYISTTVGRIGWRVSISLHLLKCWMRDLWYQQFSFKPTVWLMACTQSVPFLSEAVTYKSILIW